jgi:hypothetical protein
MTNKTQQKKSENQKTQQKTPKNKITIEVDVLGTKWKETGDTVLDALQSFKMDFSEIKGNGMIKVTTVDKELVKRFNAVMLRRILTNKMIKAHWAKNLEMLIK